LSNEICEDCHAAEFLKLQEGGHSEENCSECHGDHQVVTKPCDECHGEYHGYSYPKCLECHEPMHADVLLFSLLAIITSIAVSIGLVIYNKRRSEE
jgi:hypothetical protein